jgi:predicted dehydrogenase
MYRVGIVGLTGIAAGASRQVEGPLTSPMPGSHAAAFAVLPQTQVVAICELKPELMDQFTTQWGKVWPEVRRHTDFREMIAKERLDILTVATSDHRHADIVVAAAEAGVRGIFCEKPLATSLGDADRMIAAVEKHGTKMLVDHTRRWYPLYNEVRRLIREGAIGKLSRIVVSLGGPRSMVFRNGTHLIDLICFFAESDPAWVFAELDDEFHDSGPAYAGDGGRDPATDPGVSGYIHFQNDVRAFYNGSKDTPSGIWVDLFGERGKISVNDGGGTLSRTVEGQGLVDQPIRVPEYRSAKILAGMEELIHLLEHEGEPSSSARDGRRVVEIILAMLASQHRGNVRVDLPLKT